MGEAESRATSQGDQGMERPMSAPPTTDRVRITAADFNGQTWDGSPFSDAPNWLLSAIEGGMIRAHTRGSTDYARFHVTTPEGVVDAGPGDEIVRAGTGSLQVEVYRGR